MQQGPTAAAVAGGRRSAVADGGVDKHCCGMTTDPIQLGSQRRVAALRTVRVGLRGALSAAALFLAYYLLPVRAKTTAQDVLWLIIALATFGGIVGLQVRSIVGSRYPRLRAIESMAVVVPLFLIGFARIYLSLSTTESHPFSMVLDHTRALYFTITVFSTVGFGDITPTTDFARVIVSVQMILDLVVLGVIVKLLLGAAERGIARRDSQQ